MNIFNKLKITWMLYKSLQKQKGPIVICFIHSFKTNKDVLAYLDLLEPKNYKTYTGSAATQGKVKIVAH